MAEPERPLVVLRLGNSDDVQSNVAEADRAHNVAAAILQASAGRLVTTVARPIWPNPNLPDLVGGWVERYEPDIVFLKVNWYWYGFESIPLRLRRQFGRAGDRVAGMGDAVQARPRIAHTRLFRGGKRLLQRVVRGDSPFTPEQVAEVMELTIRRIVAREDLCLAVKGTGYARDESGVLGPYWERFAGRRDQVSARVGALCAKLDVPYFTSVPPSKEDSGLEHGDGIHQAAPGQHRMGLEEGRVMAEAWARHTRG